MTRASQVLSLYNYLDNRTHIIGGDYAKYQDCQVSDYQLLPDISPAAGVESKYFKKIRKCTAATNYLPTYLYLPSTHLPLPAGLHAQTLRQGCVVQC